LVLGGIIIKIWFKKWKLGLEMFPRMGSIGKVYRLKVYAGKYNSLMLCTTWAEWFNINIYGYYVALEINQ
jgi:hypothetical protein